MAGGLALWPTLSNESFIFRMGKGESIEIVPGFVASHPGVALVVMTHVYLNPHVFPLIKPIQAWKKDKLFVASKNKFKVLVWRITTRTASYLSKLHMGNKGGRDKTIRMDTGTSVQLFFTNHN